MKTIKAKFILIILLALSLSSIGIGAGSFAIYTNSRYAQRTAAMYQANGDRFSSNYLVKLPFERNVRTAYTHDPSIKPTAPITVCNYEQNKQSLTYERDIYYKITAKLVYFESAEYKNATSAYMTSNSLTAYSAELKFGSTVKTLDSTHLSVFFEGELESGAVDYDIYNVFFSANFITAPVKPNLYVAVTATPYDSAEKRTSGIQSEVLPVINAVFKPDIRLAGATNMWSGAISDDTSDVIGDYSGFNYRITGVGRGTVTLSWDGTKVKLSDYHKKVLSEITGATTGVNSITFPVDSDVTNLYDVVFYIVSMAGVSWGNMESTVITFTFVG